MFNDGLNVDDYKFLIKNMAELGIEKLNLQVENHYCIRI